MKEKDFEPKIVAFLCNWCSYAGADLAGVSRFQYPPNIRIIRVMCSGRIDPFIIVETFLSGADGVFIGGCHLGDCHYLEGNYNAIGKIKLAGKLIAFAGLEPERLRLEWISASEGERFSKVVADFIGQVKGLGPSPVNDERNERLRTMLKAASASAMDSPLRTLVGRQFKITEKGNVYGDKVDAERMEELVDVLMRAEVYRHLILEALSDEPKSVKGLAKELDLPTDEVLKHVVSLRMENKVGDAGHEGMTPLYVALKAGCG